MAHLSRRRGTTLVEILISLAVVLVGMMALFRALASSVTGSMTASRLSQAQQRAVAILEAIRLAPTTSLGCLASNLSSAWHTCELDCLTQLGGGASAQSCVYTTASMQQIPGPDPSGAAQYSAAGQQSDRNLQRYDLVTGGASVSQVSISGGNARVYDVTVVVGWNDDNSAASTTPRHSVTLRAGYFQ